MQNIQREAQILSKSQLDIDLLRRKYKKREGDVNITFPSPYLLGYEKFRHFLLANSTKKRLDSKYFYRPDYLSYDEYGTTIFWTVLMFINNIWCLEDFVTDDIYIPNYFSLTKMADLNDEEKNILDLDSVIVEKEYWPKLYKPDNYNKYVKEDTVDVYANLEPYRRETFIITIGDIKNKYVELNQIPIVASVVVRLKGQIFIPLYGVHYIIKENSSQENKILGWSNEDAPSGTGMENVILLNTILEVQYQTESSS